MSFEGYDGKIEINDEGVTISKQGDHFIPFSDIRFVTIKKPGLRSGGCIFIQAEGAKTYSPEAAAADFASETNAVLFKKDRYEDAADFVEQIEKARYMFKKPAETVYSIQSDIMDKKDELIGALKLLTDAGVLTEEEYREKKNALLQRQ